MTILEFEHVTKEYRLGQFESLRQTLVNQWRRISGKPVATRAPFKALDDISFSVNEGEVVGIIGHNGAGKSTMLKVLSGITTPTSGSVRVRGRIAPLIEVGAGFVPNLTGRENVFLNGAILGMSRKEIEKKFDEIVDFAEMAEFIDTPVKRYSSGMQVKLAFSVATSIESEILIVDEVLAVGDLAFQRKCFDRMEELIKRQGRTVLLVSHNIRHVQRLCSRTMLLDHGRISLDGDPKQVCNAFYEYSDKRIHETKRVASGRTESSGDVDMLSARILGPDGEALDEIHYQDFVQFEIVYKVNNRLPEPVFGIGVHTTDFLYLATSQSIGQLMPGTVEPGEYTVRYRVPRFPFLPGVYSLRVGVALAGSFQPVYYSENVLPVQVVARDVNRAVVSAQNEGFIAMEGDWEWVDSRTRSALSTVEAH